MSNHYSRRLRPARWPRATPEIMDAAFKAIRGPDPEKEVVAGDSVDNAAPLAPVAQLAGSSASERIGLTPAHEQAVRTSLRARP